LTNFHGCCPWDRLWIPPLHMLEQHGGGPGRPPRLGHGILGFGDSDPVHCREHKHAKLATRGCGGRPEPSKRRSKRKAVHDGQCTYTRGHTNAGASACRRMHTRKGHTPEASGTTRLQHPTQGAQRGPAMRGHTLSCRRRRRGGACISAARQINEMECDRGNNQ
jgi:hypothetical protein